MEKEVMEHVFNFLYQYELSVALWLIATNKLINGYEKHTQKLNTTMMRGTWQKVRL